MRKKVIIFFVIICILSISCISILTYCKPIKIENIDKSKRICDELYITSSKKYMSREDFLGMILSVVGLNENIFDMYCYGMDREGFATDDLKTGNQYQITNDISKVEFDKIYRYDTLCYIACDVNILQTYKKTYEYRGKNYITIKDAIVMIEACLEDTETEKGKFFEKSKEYQYVEGLLRKKYRTRIKVDDKSITIKYSDTDDLNRLLELMGVIEES